MANEILVAGGNFDPIGKNWQIDFIKRNPRVNAYLGVILKTTRAKCITRDAVQDYFNYFQKVFEEYYIIWDNIYNVDEVGLKLGRTHACTVIGPSENKQERLVSPKISK